MLPYYQENIIKEYLDENYVGFSTYKGSKIDSIARTLDPEVFEFMKPISMK